MFIFPSAEFEPISLYPCSESAVYKCSNGMVLKKIDSVGYCCQISNNNIQVYMCYIVLVLRDKVSFQLIKLYIYNS